MQQDVKNYHKFYVVFAKTSMFMKKLFYIFALVAFALASCDKNEETDRNISNTETLISDIDVSKLNIEAKRYYGNMAKFISLTTPDLKSDQLSKIKSATNDDSDSLLNPIVEEFANLDIVDESGTKISFFDLTDSEKEIFLDQWATTGADAMTPKLNDQEIGKELEEYVQIQNDAFDEVMAELGNTGRANIKSSVAKLSQNELYDKISSKVIERIKQKSEVYANELLQRNPGLSKVKKNSKSDTDHPDFVEPSKVLEQLRTHANRGDVLINLPGSVWLSAYLFYYDPLAITKYIGIGKYPPGHVSIITKTKTEIYNEYSDVSISSQNYTNRNGVQYEQIDPEWNCKAHLCYVKKREWRWRGFRSGFVNVYPNVDKVIAYAESQIGKPYCSGWDFITAKFRDNCFICSTITWRSFELEGFNTHRLLARWMPTIAPADMLLSDNVVEKHKIK